MIWRKYQRLGEESIYDWKKVSMIGRKHQWLGESANDLGKVSMIGEKYQ